jgi:undecaprenyl-diphosphatase
VTSRAGIQKISNGQRVQALNQSLFLLLNAGQNTPAMLVAAARFLADAPVWLVPAGLVAGWLRGSVLTRQRLLAATMTALIALLINQLIGQFWYHPRPLALGLGHTLIPHVLDSSFPSDHLTLIWGVAFALLLHRSTRLAGGVLALCGLPVAWARIYLGVHFPLDMLGAAGVALGSAGLMFFLPDRWMAALTQFLLKPYWLVCGPAIRHGWVKK